jgi:glycosyltransferase involved in cell wall biosynthesis
MKITAIIAIRNEAKYLPVTLQHLVDSDIQLAIIDHDSEDASKEICAKFKRHIVYEDRLPYTGYFSLTNQLKAKAKAISLINSDWIIHQDADEILQSPKRKESLRNGIERIARQGFNVINFDEFVFTPTQQEPDIKGHDFYRSMLHYYFFEPRPMRLMRAWKNLPGIRQIGGGHILKADTKIKIAPEPFVLRHYIVLNQDHANSKYSQRHFSPEDLAQGWHASRLQVPPVVNLPNQTDLEKLSAWDSKAFNKNNPKKSHFWKPGWQQSGQDTSMTDLF